MIPNMVAFQQSSLLPEIILDQYSQRMSTPKKTTL